MGCLVSLLSADAIGASKRKVYKMKNYTVTWTWNRFYNKEMNMQQTVITDCTSQEDAEQKAFKYMHEVWIDPCSPHKFYETLRDMIDDCFASFMVTCEPDDAYCTVHAQKYWWNELDETSKEINKPIIDGLTYQGFFDDLREGHYLGYRCSLHLTDKHYSEAIREDY